MASQARPHNFFPSAFLLLQISLLFCCCFHLISILGFASLKSIVGFFVFSLHQPCCQRNSTHPPTQKRISPCFAFLRSWICPWICRTRRLKETDPGFPSVSPPLPPTQQIFALNCSTQGVGWGLKVPFAHILLFHHFPCLLPFAFGPDLPLPVRALPLVCIVMLELLFLP